jgi:hypothetical protein
MSPNAAANFSHAHEIRHLEGLIAGGQATRSAEKAYGQQLRSWVELQVDSRVNCVLHGLVEGELIAARQDAATALAMAERIEAEVGTAAGAQSKLLNVVEGMSEEMDSLKALFVDNSAKLNDIANSSQALMSMEKVMSAVGDLRQTVASRDQQTAAHLSRHEGEIDEHRRLHSHQERRLLDFHQLWNAKEAELRDCVAETASQRQLKEDESLVHASAKQLEMRQQLRLANMKSELTSEIAEKLSSAETARRSEEQHLNSRIETLRSDLASSTQRLDERLDARLEGLRVEVAAVVSLRADVDVRFEQWTNNLRVQMVDELAAQKSALSGLKSHVDSSQNELLATLQRGVADLRAETTAAFRSESAAISGLDEQLWLTDQRLGQRIDELANLRVRERAMAVEQRCKDFGFLPDSEAPKVERASSPHMSSSSRRLSDEAELADAAATTGSGRKAVWNSSTLSAATRSKGGTTVVWSDPLEERVAKWSQRDGSPPVPTISVSVAEAAAAASSKRTRSAGAVSSSGGARTSADGYSRQIPSSPHDPGFARDLHAARSPGLGFSSQARATSTNRALTSGKEFAAPDLPFAGPASGAYPQRSPLLENAPMSAQREPRGPFRGGVSNAIQEEGSSGASGHSGALAMAHEAGEAFARIGGNRRKDGTSGGGGGAQARGQHLSSSR